MQIDDRDKNNAVIAAATVIEADIVKQLTKASAMCSLVLLKPICDIRPHETNVYTQLNYTSSLRLSCAEF